MGPPQITYIDHNSILVINHRGKNRQIFVPFRVQVMQETNILKIHTWVYIEEVMPQDQNKMLYRVTSNWWAYNIFRIQIHF